MADYRSLAIGLISVDGKIDETEIKLVKKALATDGKITHEEINFLLDLRAAVNKKNAEPTPAFDKFFLKFLGDSVLDNGIVSAEEVGILKKVVADKKLPAEDVKKFLDKCKKTATKLDPSFDKLYEAFMKKMTSAA